MAIEVKAINRVFKYGTMQLDDPDCNMKPEEVREFYSSIYPELTQASIEGPEYPSSGEAVYIFKKAVGTKG